MAGLEEIRGLRNEHNPFAQHLGIETVRLAEGEADCTMVLKPEHLNLNGVIHGGVLLTLADVATGSATASYGINATTSSGEYHFLRAVQGSTTLSARARVIKRGINLIVCDVEIFDDRNILVGKGTFTLFVLG